MRGLFTAAQAEGISAVQHRSDLLCTGWGYCNCFAPHLQKCRQLHWQKVKGETRLGKVSCKLCAQIWSSLSFGTSEISSKNSNIDQSVNQDQICYLKFTASNSTFPMQSTCTLRRFLQCSSLCRNALLLIISCWAEEAGSTKDLISATKCSAFSMEQVRRRVVAGR